jgi:hypothetical protein
MSELGIDVSKEGTRSMGLSKLKASWNERREVKRIANGDSSWGADSGKAEESRILEYLDRKLSKENNTVNIQLVPEWKPLLSTMPSGMNMPIDGKWKPPVLEEDELAAMRGPPDEDELNQVSSDDEDKERKPVGVFPGAAEDYERSTYY